MQWCVCDCSQSQAVRKVHQSGKGVLSKEARGQGRQGEHDGLLNPSDICPIKWLPFVSPERNRDLNIIVKIRIILRQRLRDEKTSEEEQENIEIYVANKKSFNTFDLLKTEFIFGEFTDIQFPPG